MNLWKIKLPSLRAARLKIIFKDVFSNERRHRFKIAASPMCTFCGQVETVEHQLFLCANAARLWQLYQRITHRAISSLYDLLICENNIPYEIVKSVFVRALLQIDRSSGRVEKDILSECVYYLNIEARSNSHRSEEFLQLAARVSTMR